METILSTIVTSLSKVPLPLVCWYVKIKKSRDKRYVVIVHPSTTSAVTIDLIDFYPHD
jgi:hypothetical protein